jgi:hypothetical protein
VARSRTVGVWTLALWALCLVAATAGDVSGPGDPVSSHGTSPAVGILAPAADVAVLPAKVADEIRVSAHFSNSRALVLVAVPALLIGLPAVLRRGAAVAGREHRRLRTCRHVIALRAPPVQFA